MTGFQAIVLRLLYKFYISKFLSDLMYLSAMEFQIWASAFQKLRPVFFFFPPLSFSSMPLLITLLPSYSVFFQYLYSSSFQW